MVFRDGSCHLKRDNTHILQATEVCIGRLYDRVGHTCPGTDIRQGKSETHRDRRVFGSNYRLLNLTVGTSRQGCQQRYSYYEFLYLHHINSFSPFHFFTFTPFHLYSGTS